MLKLLQEGEAKIAVVGLGYVGLPLAVAFSEHFSVIGYDRDERKIIDCRAGVDPMGELAASHGAAERIEFTTDEAQLRAASFIVIAVPTPIKGDKTPDLEPLMQATHVVGRHLQPGSIVVYESTVYPGVTEDICCAILEEESGLMRGAFKIGYSPERINPGDKVHRLENIVKIVSGMDDETLKIIAEVYGTIIETLHPAPSIRVAEAAKVAENAQRDINIAFMNELAMVFQRMNIDTTAVVKAMDTKWNALGFRPGLVGGHCIGVDPYYFIYQAQNLGYHSPLISTGRRINDGMSGFVAHAVVRELVRTKIDLARANVYLFGMAFKENCPDTRNSRAADVYSILKEYDLALHAVDPEVDEAEFCEEYGFGLDALDKVRDADCIAILVAHEAFAELSWLRLRKMFRADGPRLLVDVKGVFSRKEAEREGFRYWRL